jgi:excisionase family DNA binding protein
MRRSVNIVATSNINNRKRGHIGDENPTNTVVFCAGSFANTDVLAEEIVKEIISITLLTPKQVQKILQISHWSFEQLINNRHIEIIRVGNKRLVTLTELKAFIVRQATGR